MKHFVPLDAPFLVQSLQIFHFHVSTLTALRLPLYLQAIEVTQQSDFQSVMRFLLLSGLLSIWEAIERQIEW